MPALLLVMLGCAGDPCADGAAWLVVPAHDTHRTGPRITSSIQDAVDQAEPGTTICIASGTWEESVRIRTSDLTLRGVGPETVLESPGPEAGEDSAWSLIRVQTERVRLETLVLQGAGIGVELPLGTSAELDGVELRDNAIGVQGIDPKRLEITASLIQGNTTVGVEVLSTQPFRWPEVTVADTVIQANGTLGVSDVGGLASAYPTQLSSVTFRDNAGSVAADLYATHTVVSRDLLVERPASVGGAPRVRLDRGGTLTNSQLQTNGGVGISARCDASDSLDVTNLALIDSDASTSALTVDGCPGRVVHATLVNAGSTSSPSAIRHSGRDPLELTNNAYVGLSAPLDTDTVHVNSSFQGGLDQAALVRPMDVLPDLRPQSDSPLVDAGEDLGVEEDLDGVPRPNGSAPDIGAYELYAE